MNPDMYKKSYRSNQLQMESSDQFSELALNWDVSWRQLQKGRFTGDLLSIEDHEVQIYQFSMNRSVEMLGCAPGGNNGRSFGFMRHGSYFGTWCDKQVFDDSLIVWGKNGEYEAITPSEFDVNTVTLSEELLIHAAQTMDYHEPLDSILSGRLIRLKQGSRIKQIRDQLELLRYKVIRQPENPSHFNFWQDAKFVIAQHIIAILVDDLQQRVRPITPAQRRLALKHALDYIQENLTDPISVRELSHYAGVSERTLQYAFQEHYHISPKAYLKAIRLNGAHKQLRQADPDTTLVVDVANVWGFWHMGQFAADYNTFFSEKPLSTLRHRA